MRPLGYEDHQLLPASAPVGQAHIIEDEDLKNDGDVTKFPSKGFKFCDYIVTFLNNLDQYPNALKDFFDPNIKFFHIVRRYKEGQSNHIIEFMISRKKHRVIAGYYWVLADGHKLEWESATKTRLSEVAPDATWKTTWGARQAYSYTPTESIWDKTFYRANQPCYMGANPRKAKEANKVADQFGKSLFILAAWKEDEESVITLETKK